MAIHPLVYHGWVAITSIIAIIATTHYVTHWLSTLLVYDDIPVAQPLLRILKSVVVACYTAWKQSTRALGELGRWTTDQASSALGRWGVAILCLCIVLILVLRWFLSSVGSDEPSSIPLKRQTSDVSGDAELQSGEPIRELVSSYGQR